jgi:pimeloyl-ACP methyl ester carboxylesterase
LHGCARQAGQLSRPSPPKITKLEFNAKGVLIPVAVTVFPGEQYQAPRSWAEQAYPNLVYFNEVDRGGHFAAWEQPQLFTEELRAAFRSLR